MESRWTKRRQELGDEEGANLSPSHFRVPVAIVKGEKKSWLELRRVRIPLTRESGLSSTTLVSLLVLGVSLTGWVISRIPFNSEALNYLSQTQV